MSNFLSREQLRACDRRAIEEFGVPGVVLMENAGRGAAELLLSLGVGGPVVVCCGKGNNGGDGFVIARHLANAGAAVRVLLFADPKELTGDAAVHYRVVEKMKVPVLAPKPDETTEAWVAQQLALGDPRWDGDNWVIDALFGTGLTGPVKPPFDAVITAINAGRRTVVAVDIPSGLDCDTGQPQLPTVRADLTATFVALKKGFAAPVAKPYLGRVKVIDIGAPRAILAALTSEPAAPARAKPDPR